MTLAIFTLTSSLALFASMMVFYCYFGVLIFCPSLTSQEKKKIKKRIAVSLIATILSTTGLFYTISIQNEVVEIKPSTVTKLGENQHIYIISDDNKSLGKIWLTDSEWARVAQWQTVKIGFNRDNKPVKVIEIMEGRCKKIG